MAQTKEERAAYLKAYAQKNREKRNEISRRYYQKNKEKCADSVRAYRKKNRKLYLAYQIEYMKNYRLKNKLKIDYYNKASYRKQHGIPESDTIFFQMLHGAAQLTKLK